MPVRADRLDEARPLRAGFGSVLIEAPSGLQDAVDGRRADGADTVVEHHERQAAVALERMLDGVSSWS